MGDSITAGYTDNTSNSADGSGGWNVPFEFGYRRQLHHLLTNAGYDFLFVGQSAEPFNFLETGYGDPTKGGTVSPQFDLRTTVPPQNGHRGYGGIRPYQLDAALDSDNYIENDTPGIILLMVGINGITDQVVSGRPPSTGQLDALITKIFTKKPTVHLVVAEISPYGQSTVEPYATRNPIIVNYNTYIRDVLVPKFQGQGRSISRVNQHKHFLSDPNTPSSATLTSLYSNLINHPTNAAYDTMAQTWFEGLLAVTPPTLPVLDQSTLILPLPPGAAAGSFAQPPAPSTETLSFSLVADDGDADNAKFTISDDDLRVAAHDFSDDPNGTTYSIRVKATGNTGGQTGERAFTLTLGSDPDSDDDTIPDSWELSYAGNLTKLTLTGDFDIDGLSDTAEHNLSLGTYPGINPTDPDTDGDGFKDGAETTGAGLRPATNPTISDTDGDDVGDLNDGIHGGYTSNPVDGGWSDNTDVRTSTFTLPTGPGHGWDLTNITTIADWSGGGFGNQCYNVSVLKVGEADFIPLASVNFQPLGTGTGGTRVQITKTGGTLAANVLKIRFNMLKTIGTDFRAVYREFDAFGTQSGGPPPADPMPTTEILTISPPTAGETRASITWRSYPGNTYQVESSENLGAWTILDSAFPSGGVTTTYRTNAESTPPFHSFFRVSPNP